jgi:hypothetical protein
VVPKQRLIDRQKFLSISGVISAGNVSSFVRYTEERDEKIDQNNSTSDKD